MADLGRSAKDSRLPRRKSGGVTTGIYRPKADGQSTFWCPVFSIAIPARAQLPRPPVLGQAAAGRVP